MNKHQGFSFLLGSRAAGGVLFLPVVTLGFFVPSLKPEGLIWFCVFWIVCIALGIRRVFRNRISFRVPASDSSFEIKYGDIFDDDGVIVIAVNEYFDGMLGCHVSETSLHGKFIKDKLGGQSETFIKLTRGALAGVEPEETVTRCTGECDRYPIGTVARVSINEQCYLLSVLSHTTISSNKAFASVEDLLTCLAGVWKGVREHSGGRPVRIPLIGSGLSGIGLPEKVLTGIIVTSFICHTKKEKVADKVTLVLPRRLRGTLDLNTIGRSWK